MRVLHEDGVIVHGVLLGRMEVLRDHEHEDSEGQCDRSYPGGDRIVTA
jgi:hypothetical protein